MRFWKDASVSVVGNDKRPITTGTLGLKEVRGGIQRASYVAHKKLPGAESYNVLDRGGFVGKSGKILWVTKENTTKTPKSEKD